MATVFGAGYSPIAPGTAGALVACIIVYIMSLLVEVDVMTLSVSIILCYIIGIWSINCLNETWPHDDNKIVLDEVIGIFVSIFFLPYSIKLLICAFILFRFFDIVKPFGIRRIDNFRSNHAVLLDDILAGIYTNIVLQIIFRWGIVQ